MNRKTGLRKILNIRIFLFAALIGVLLTPEAFARQLLLEESRPNVQGVTVKRWTYDSAGLKVKGELYLPPGKEKLPLIVFNHDGISGISKEHRLSSVRLAKQGFVVFSPSYRGEDGSQGVIEIAKGEVDDVLNVLPLLKKHARVNPERIGMMGASHGALISVLAASRNKEVKAVVAAYGVMDIYKWHAYLKRVGKLGNDAITLRTYGPGPAERPQSFAIRNALSVVPQIDCPVLLLQGSLDDIVPEEQADFMEQAMKKAGKRVEKKVYPDALHGFLVYAPYISDATKEEKRQTEEAWKTLIAFFKKEL